LFDLLSRSESGSGKGLEVVLEALGSNHGEKEVVVEAASESNRLLSSPSKEARFPSMESGREEPWK
jgi:hypothetical protein